MLRFHRRGVWHCLNPLAFAAFFALSFAARLPLLTTDPPFPLDRFHSLQGLATGVDWLVQDISSRIWMHD